MHKTQYIVLILCLLACLVPSIAKAQVSLEEYFDTKEEIAANKNYIYGESNHASLEFAEADAFQRLMDAAKSAATGMRCFVPKEKQQSIVCRRNGKYYVFCYCMAADVVYDSDAAEPVDTYAMAQPMHSAQSSEATTCPGNVRFAFADGEIIDAAGNRQPALAKNMEQSMSLLLSELNNAYNKGIEPGFDNIKIDPRAKRMFLGLWQAYPFVCNSPQYRLPALCDVRGYQIRGIDITKHSTNDDEAEDNDKELCVCFDASGTITCINFSKSLSFKKMNPNVTDKRRELEILQFIENFRCYYVNHDLEALETLFSEDAIIITGKVTMQRDASTRKDGPKFTKGTKYEVKDKRQYMKSLASIFSRHPHIDVKFDDIQLSQHPSRSNVYAVNLVQTWNSKTYQGAGYSDIGYLHLLFDFPDHGDPRIHVRAWQPLDTDKKDIITIDSYDD